MSVHNFYNYLQKILKNFFFLFKKKKLNLDELVIKYSNKILFRIKTGTNI